MAVNVQDEEKAKLYFEYKLRGALDSKQAMLDLFSVTSMDMKKYETLAKCFQRNIEVSEEQFNHFRAEYDKAIALFKTYVTSERLEGFEKDLMKFYAWYDEQPKQCCYCGIKEEHLKQFFDDKYSDDYPNKRGRGKKLEIERIADQRNEKHKGYIPENMRLACHICNNAKSDFLSPAQFKPIAYGVYCFWKNNNVQDIEFPENDAIWEHL